MRYSLCPTVYAFFDASSCSYEIYPSAIFHPLFPWFQCGAKFDTAEARLDRHPPFPENVDMSSIGGYCVPQLYSRRVPSKDGWGATRKLIYDDWMLPEAATTWTPAYWDSDEAVKVMAGATNVDIWVNSLVDKFLQSEGDNGCRHPPANELLEDVENSAPPSYFGLKDLEEAFLHCGHGNQTKSRRTSTFEKEFASPPVIDHDAGGYFGTKDEGNPASHTVHVLEKEYESPIIDYETGVCFDFKYADGLIPRFSSPSLEHYKDCVPSPFVEQQAMKDISAAYTGMNL